jgi:hypothetical protein
MRHLVLFSVLLLGTVWAAAQNYPSQGSTGNAAGQQSVKGCLSSAAGTYSITDKSGKTYQLAGDTSKLSEHVGHEVKVMGTVSSASASSSGGGQPTLEVTSFKHIAKTCESGGGVAK